MKVSSNFLTEPTNRIKYFILKGNYINYPVYEPHYNSIHYALKNGFTLSSDLHKQAVEIPEGSFIVVKNSVKYLLNNFEASNSIIVSFLVDTQILQNLTHAFHLNTFTLYSNINFDMLKSTNYAHIHRQNIDKACYGLIESAKVADIDLNNILKEMFSYAESYNLCNRTTTKPMIEEILEFIRSNPSIVNLKVLSQRYNYSISYISELIHKETGLTFSQTLKSIRMAQSLKLLTNTDKTLNEISEAIGYTSTSGFIVAFQDMYNMTPSEYRRSNSNLS